MNTLNDTLDTLLPDARDLAWSILEGAVSNFERDGGVLPVAFYVDPAGRRSLIGIDELSDRTKPDVWNMLAQLREHNPIVFFISEVWMAKCGPGNMNPDGTVKVMPRNAPNKTEHILLNLWQGGRIVSFINEIHRQPDKLEGWKVMFDSRFPEHTVMGKKADSVGGEMMKGGRYPLEDN